ncbi:MAG: hypothetical protein HUU22_11650 [Phycisphaerae bacterium]|nr:hypothetical protein [Phycisphaerae bacterium]NUQ46676.1 hypothetical protein [Phycisphaerae bacterium]
MRLLRSDEYWDRTRRRMIAETEQFLTLALREPFRGPVIPSYPVGRGRLSARLAAVYWQRILFDGDAAPLTSQWKILLPAGRERTLP